MDWLGVFAFGTAFPFGYLISAVGFLVALAFGLKLLLRGLGARPVDRARVAGGGAMLAMLGFFVVANGVYGGALEMNPAVTPVGVTGEWRLGGARLWLHADGTYRCQGYSECNIMRAEGRWWLEDTRVLIFEALDGQRTPQDLVRYFGALRLTDPIGDPDSWEGRLTFAHVEPSRR